MAPAWTTARWPAPSNPVLDRAGHALLHEQPEIVQAHIAEWLQRIRER
jgi:hypothetical protein